MEAAVLDSARHERLLADLDHICQVANIPKALISQSATEVCNAKEVEWLRRFRMYQAEGKSLLLTGSHTPSAETKMMAMAAAFLRNFIDARVMSLNRVLEEADEGIQQEATVLLIPNFHIGHAVGRNLPAWRIQALYDLLLARMSQGRMNVLYAADPLEMRKEYGPVFADHVKAFYIESEGE